MAKYIYSIYRSTYGIQYYSQNVVSASVCTTTAKTTMVLQGPVPKTMPEGMRFFKFLDYFCLQICSHFLWGYLCTIQSSFWTPISKDVCKEHNSFSRFLIFLYSVLAKNILMNRLKFWHCTQAATNIALHIIYVCLVPWFSSCLLLQRNVMLVDNNNISIKENNFSNYSWNRQRLIECLSPLLA